MKYDTRIINLRRLMKGKGLKNLLVTKLENVYYLSGLYSTSAALIITSSKQFLLTDARYFLRAEKLSDVFEPVKVTNGLINEIIKVINSLNIKKMAFEENSVNYKVFKDLNKFIKLKESGGLVEMLRRLKDDDEIRCLKKAGGIIKNAMVDIKKEIRVGLTEKKIASKLNCSIFKYGADSIAFPTIVASGSNSAVPHHETSNKTVKEGDFVLIDAGACFNHYHSDMTRTFIAGKPSKKQKKILKIIKEAQLKAINTASVGIELKELDNKARNLVEYSGYGNCFTHGLGHSIGLEVHEVPYVNKSSEVKIKAGNVFTIEPAIYIKDFGGVRIEDTVLVTEKGVELLT